MQLLSPRCPRVLVSKLATCRLKASYALLFSMRPRSLFGTLHKRCLQLDSTRLIVTRPARSAAFLRQLRLRSCAARSVASLDNWLLWHALGRISTVTVGQFASHIGFDASSCS